MASTNLRHVRTIRVTTEQEIGRLNDIVRDLERRYCLDSEEMAAAVADGRMHETADVAEWLISWKVLNEMKAELSAGRKAAGSHTKRTA